MSRPAAEILTFACTCGALHGHITPRGVRFGTHVGCYCHDCRAAQLYFKQPDPAPGPVDILHTSPEEIRIERGLKYLAAMQLGPNGMLRWYAKCCDAPLATTPQTAKLPFAGFIVERLSDTAPLGPITTLGFVPQPDGKQRHERLRFAIFGFLRRVLTSRLTGRWKASQFFLADTAKPAITPTILSKEQRAALYD